MEILQGGCLCGEVQFEIENAFENFHFCHCEQCQIATGTAFAANLFTSPQAISWTKGEALVVRYDVPGRRISNVFCSLCGSRLPWLSLSGDTLAVPAGSLRGEPSVGVGANIFWPEKASWYQSGQTAPCHDYFKESS